jgi:ABC-type sugar transport system substrate-binding protein
MIDQSASLWQDLLQRFPNVRGGFSIRMIWRLAARSVVEALGLQDQVLIVGVDGLKNAPKRS